jgi:peptidoglycan/LPS O-acetylase OafA/YrhL
MPDKRIASLDGLRAVSVCLVILYHLGQTPGFDRLAIVRGLADFGFFGVQIFFVISGFLITWLLLVEESENGSFSISAFYGRRALRILPPALFYLLVIACLKMLGLASVSTLDLTASALFFRNVSGQGSTETGHFWTLSIEEQFYLFWPFILILVRNNKLRLWLLVALVMLAPIWRHFNHLMAGGAQYVHYGRLDLRADPLMIGCILAFLRFDKNWLTVLRKPFLQSPISVVGATILLVFELVGPVPRSLLFLTLALQCSCVALLMSYWIDRPDGWSGRILNWTPVVWLGTLSYSLYIWNQFFLKTYPDHPFWIRKLPQSLLATFLAACFSFYALERPFARLRRVFFRPKRQSSPAKPPLISPSSVST